MINSPHICNEMTPFQRLKVVTRNGIHVKNVFETTNIILNFIGKEKLTAVVLLHMSKAFDSVNHKTLILKLQDVATSSHTLQWFLSYLSNRKRGLPNTPKLSPMEEGHEQPDSPEDSLRET